MRAITTKFCRVGEPMRCRRDGYGVGEYFDAASITRISIRPENAFHTRLDIQVYQ